MILLLACAGGSPGPGALPAGAGPEACDDEKYEQLRIGCLVDVGAQAGREGDADRADAACAGVPEGTWRDECHFRSGEELGRAGVVEGAFRHCAEAGRFSRFCVTHAGWGLPPSDAPLSTWLAATAPLAEPLRADAIDIVTARWWFDRYVGTGVADPAPAKAAPIDPEVDGHALDEGPYARGAWAIEAERLIGPDVDAIRAAWDGPGPTGPSIPVDERHGRYDAPFQIAGEKDLRRVRTFGSGKRLVGATPEEDLDVAILEALWYDDRVRDGAIVAPWLHDPRPTVRYTAVRIFRTIPSAQVEATLAAMRDDPDPIVRAHVEDGLRYRTWEGKKRR